MNVKLVPVPWIVPKPTKEAVEGISIIGDNVWKESSIEFYAKREAKMRAKASAPKGMQRIINEILDRKFEDQGWLVDAGHYIKNDTWIRVTFRHQMSLGSDIIDAMKVCKKEGIVFAIILAANRNTLNIISPNDAAAIISFEKLQREVMSLDGVVDIPLVIGELTPKTHASRDIEDSLYKKRLRDRSVPMV